MDPANAAQRQLVRLLEDVPSADGYRYDAKDSAGNGMDTLKIIANPSGGYLGVYHTLQDGNFAVKLATSTNLLDWQYRADLAPNASQPTLAALPGGGFLAAWESDNRPQTPFKSWLQLRHYPSLEDLLAGRSDRVFDAPHTLVPPDGGAEGTPNIYSVSLQPDIDHSVIDVGFHYFKSFDVDRQARGQLVDFQRWSTRVEETLNRKVEAYQVGGNIGGRDCLTYQGIDFSLIEGQFVKSDFGSWRTFLYNGSTGANLLLQIRTHGGTASFANPKFTRLNGPSGAPAIVTTIFLPSNGAAAGEAGELIYYKYLGG